MPSDSGSAMHRPDRGHSWMSPDAKKRNLLYVTDQGTGEVKVFSYPQGKLHGTLTGFNEPAGECADRAGDVFIVDGFANEVYEYAHGGKTPIATLSEPGEFPLGCSVDPSTGNLAVANYCSGASGQCTGPGSLAIYLDAKGSPTQYADPKLSHVDFCGYDAQGNLFVDGNGINGHAFAFAEFLEAIPGCRILK